MCKYLYGAAVQGIQKYIFQTNKLKDIIGASELVKFICDEVFCKEFAGSGEVIVHAAGNVKCVYSSKEECENAVMYFPKRVMEKAPGITVSQAVVKYDDSTSFKNINNELEKRLHAQRNRPCKSITTGYLATERSRTTGLPAVDIVRGEYIDEGTRAKREILEVNNVSKTLCSLLVDRNIGYDEIGWDTKDITDQNDWIAIIHADGNALGEVVEKVGSDSRKLSSFSQLLDEATKCAAQRAYRNIECKDLSEKNVLPIRPIVIGGDDLTVICRASLAVEFVKNYMRFFEEECYTKIKQRLTACAGIAFTKSSYPFYFGYELAETLCGIAKKDAKSDKMKDANNVKIPACLMFHKVQSSFVEDYETIKRKELTPVDGHSFCFGPYYLDEQKDRWTVENLQETVEELAKDVNNPIKTSVRQWLTLMHDDINAAKQKQERVCSIVETCTQKGIFSKLTEGYVRNDEACYPAYDVLSLLTIQNQITK